MSARHLLLSALLLGISGQALADTWSDLWSTHEQQGQKLLDANHPDKAAQLFSDPKRRAYAELQAGQYAKAADLLAPLKDADSQYNRGNALARTGKLRDALAAYDAALASSPGNKDVMRNRELVAKAMENQQQPQQGKDGSSGKDGKGRQGQSNSGGQGSNGAADKQSGAKDSGSQDGKSAQAGQQGQSGQQGQAGNSQQDSNSATATNQAQAANPAQNPNSAGNASSAANSGQPQTPQQAASAAAQPGQHDPRNAAALQQGQASGTGTQQGAASMAESPLVKGGAPTDAQQAQPRSEQALALDQWLRSIPDDSGELLRRKFQIEHMLRQQGNEP